MTPPAVERKVGRISSHNILICPKTIKGKNSHLGTYANIDGVHTPSSATQSACDPSSSKSEGPPRVPERTLSHVSLLIENELPHAVRQSATSFSPVFDPCISVKSIAPKPGYLFSNRFSGKMNRCSEWPFENLSPRMFPPCLHILKTSPTHPLTELFFTHRSQIRKNQPV